MYDLASATWKSACFFLSDVAEKVIGARHSEVIVRQRMGGEQYGTGNAGSNDENRDNPLGITDPQRDAQRQGGRSQASENGNQGIHGIVNCGESLPKTVRPTQIRRKPQNIIKTA